MSVFLDFNVYNLHFQVLLNCHMMSKQLVSHSHIYRECT